MAQSFFKNRILAVENQNPPLQFVYEDDLARVVDIVIQRGIEGVFNVAGDGVVFYREMVESIGSRIVSIPSLVTSPVLRLSWNLGFRSKFNSAVFDMVRYPVVVSTGTLKQATGYRFWHTSMDALKAYAGSNLLNNDWNQSPC